MSKTIVIILTISILLLGILYKDHLELYFNKFALKARPSNSNVFTLEELSHYDGVNKNKLYLAIMGSIFDVSKGSKHYGKGSPYNYFVGKDGSRALISGNFQDESINKDHILDLNCDELFVLQNWKKTFMEKYPHVGTLNGRYFDNEGQETNYLKQFYERIDQCELVKEEARKAEKKHPPCNISWNADEGTRVWCTKSSGGISRSWAGMPRQLYAPGEEKPRCVCVNVTNQPQTGLYKEYDNCSASSNSCYIPN